MPEKTPKKHEKDDRDDEMLHKKRRNVKEFGCMGDFNHRCWDMKLGNWKSKDICTNKSERVVINEPQDGGNCGGEAEVEILE